MVSCGERKRSKQTPEDPIETPKTPSEYRRERCKRYYGKRLKQTLFRPFFRKSLDFLEESIFSVFYVGAGKSIELQLTRSASIISNHFHAFTA